MGGNGACRGRADAGPPVGKRRTPMKIKTMLRAGGGTIPVYIHVIRNNG